MLFSGIRFGEVLADQTLVSWLVIWSLEEVIWSLEEGFWLLTAL